MKIWFQNRRTKWKKQDNISNAEAAEHKIQTSSGKDGMMLPTSKQASITSDDSNDMKIKSISSDFPSSKLSSSDSAASSEADGAGLKQLENSKESSVLVFNKDSQHSYKSVPATETSIKILANNSSKEVIRNLPFGDRDNS